MQLLFYLATGIVDQVAKRCPIFGANLKATKCFIFFHFLQSHKGFGTISRISNAVPSEKSGLTSIPRCLHAFDVKTVQFFSPAAKS